ncbi:tail terminator [Gordonia phage Trine]|uniref:Tail terminator n=1 Tax=Gordonia phage Trine TaxID=2201431 RepID=A0A2Z4Q8W2_9CAUD|nr:tail terminator [Gordonia phage Trine]AWY06512.1 tail terminator [Gordonia phage Trine]
MTEPVYVPVAYPARLLKDHLKTVMSQRFPSLTYAAGGLDANWTTESPPALVVFDDGTPNLDWPVRTKTTLRVVVWAAGQTEARTIAAYALGQTLSRKAEGFSQVLPGTGLLDARDTNNSGIMVSYTVRARLRVTLVTEP